MKRIMFVCHGNICRSPLAEFVMKDLVNKKELSDLFYIESSATSAEETGNPIYPPIKDIMRKYSVPFEEHYAKRIKAEDYEKFDLFVIMDNNNYRNIIRILGSDPDNKVHLLLEYSGQNRDVEDPWYYGNFDKTYDDVLSGCKALLEHLEKNCLT